MRVRLWLFFNRKVKGFLLLLDFFKSTGARFLSSGWLGPCHRCAGLLTGDGGGAVRRMNFFLAHRFDLLGSGWVIVDRFRRLTLSPTDVTRHLRINSHTKEAKIRVNWSNHSFCETIWNLIDDAQYSPIDWQLDFKSGYRWSAKTWHGFIKYGHKPGVDIKVPWELARMQHLPQLALLYGASGADSELRRKIVFEFRNQILDFVATNPPRFGVNWVCPMDVAIRAVNWLTAYDILLAAGAVFDDQFKEVLVRSVYDHGLHIVRNLEWYSGHRGNHYLTDIAGLAFIASYLPATSETNTWLAFAVQELLSEVEHQFYPDGTNFEGSTAYHRLASEMVYFATALVLGLPQERVDVLKSYDHKLLKTGWGKPKLKSAPLPFYSLPVGPEVDSRESPFPPWYFDRLERMAEFIMDITKPNGWIPQIGDNDSGRFLKLAPKYELMTVREAKERYANLEGYNELPDDADYYMEDHLDCSHLVAAAYGLFRRDDFADWLGGLDKVEVAPDFLWIDALTRGVKIGSQRERVKKKAMERTLEIGDESLFLETLKELQSNFGNNIRKFEFKSKNGNLLEGLKIAAYPDFGLYIYSSVQLYLAIRCWPGREPFHTGHMHYDQLSIELILDGKELFRDPGTYVYTPFPEIRERYRSATAHFTPLAHFGAENNRDSLFRITEPWLGSLRYLGPTGFYGEARRGVAAIGLLCHILPDCVTVYHVIEGGLSNFEKFGMSVPAFSPGYGIVMRG